ncbi:MAG: hypothetical protein M1383_03770 [Patescibacteria group bacterium]|nr:hypothetical protein [Patescibacteria group bacterium]
MYYSEFEDFSFDPNNVLGVVRTVKEAQSLPAGTVVGDTEGGHSISDQVAKALRERSHRGWQAITWNGESWNYIRLDW